MFKFLIRTFLISLLFFFVENASGQVYNFSNYTVETGLPQPQVLSVFQNDDGVMWFGTNAGGIAKYDGSSYEYITDKDGLADNVVYCIVKDKKGRILIGTNNGLSVFEGKHFKNYTTQNGLSHNRIFSIFCDTKGRILLGTGKGVTLFQDTVCSLLNIGEALNSASVFNIFEDSRQNLWFSTIGKGAFKFDGKILKNYNASEGLKTPYVFSILEYKANTYWFFTDKGLFELNEKGITPITTIKSDDPKTDIFYYSYLKDRNNNIWIACGLGVLKFDGNNFHLFNQKNGLVNNNIYKIFEDKESNLWFASKENGISKLATERFYSYTVNQGLLSNTITGIYQGEGEKYFIGSDKGLNIFNGKKIASYNNRNWNGGPNIVLSIAKSLYGIYFIGTTFGILKYNGKSFERIERTDNKSLNYCYDVFIDSKGVTWLGTKGGVAKIIDGKIKEFDNTSISKKNVFKIYEDRKGDYWFATDDGLFRFDGSLVQYFTEKDGFTKKSVRNIVADKDGNLWFATSAGIFTYKKGAFSRITEKEGLFSDIIQSIAIDKKGNIWAGLPNGVDKVRVLGNGKYQINHYGIEDGFNGEDILNSILVDEQDRVWIGTENGLMVYQPKFDRKNTLEPITRLKSIQLFSQKIDRKFFANNTFDKNDLPLNLELAHDRNYLTFNFIGVSLTAPSKVRYRFRLKGLENEWQPETSKNEAVYSNIPPGSYEFLVIADNGEGVWNKLPVSFKFVILPPFWRTWWFYSIIAIVVISGVYSYIKIKSANKKILEQNEIIEEKNADLQHANIEIAEKNQSITDSINYAKRIQQSFLTSEKMLDNTLKDYFIFYKPRDIVSGDFYWAFDLPDRILLACADSTGHGIPGAFMSLIGISLLNEISHSKNMVRPSKMLDELRRIIICGLNPEELDSGGKDGMDIALISIFKSTDSDEVKISFSGANISMYIMPGHKNSPELLEFKGDKQPAAFYSQMTPFSQKEITAKKGDTVYLFTDGYADQFGGLKGKKFMSKQLKKQLTAIYTLPLKQQGAVLEKTFQEWKGNLEQVDDVTVVGIRI